MANLSSTRARTRWLRKCSHSNNCQQLTIVLWLECVFARGVHLRAALFAWVPITRRFCRGRPRMESGGPGRAARDPRACKTTPGPERESTMSRTRVWSSGTGPPFAGQERLTRLFHLPRARVTLTRWPVSPGTAGPSRKPSRLRKARRGWTTIRSANIRATPGLTPSRCSPKNSSPQSRARKGPRNRTGRASEHSLGPSSGVVPLCLSKHPPDPGSVLHRSQWRQKHPTPTCEHQYRK